MTLVGYIQPEDGLGKVTLELARCFHKDIFVNFIPTRRLPDVMPASARSLVKRPQKATNVVLFTDMLWSPTYNYLARLPKNAPIKIAYSMIESTKLHPQWTSTLNKHFDAVIVPDEWLVRVYQDSGVQIPIFVIPLSLSLEPALARKSTKKTSKPFVFGNTCALESRKNHSVLLQAFAKAFGNRKDVQLRINARYDNFSVREMIQREINNHKLRNVILTIDNLDPAQYLQLMSSFSCYVIVSKGEGFSITPREALALGIPVIVSDATAHHTIAATGLVKAVPAAISQRAYYPVFNNFQGEFFSCSVDDVAQALLDVYQNYNVYYQKAQQARTWVTQYLPQSLSPIYSQLAKPSKITLGTANRITPEGIETTSPKLYEKYRKLINK